MIGTCRSVLFGNCAPLRNVAHECRRPSFVTSFSFWKIFRCKMSARKGKPSSTYRPFFNAHWSLEDVRKGLELCELIKVSVLLILLIFFTITCWNSGKYPHQSTQLWGVVHRQSWRTDGHLHFWNERAQQSPSWGCGSCKTQAEIRVESEKKYFASFS